MAQTLVRPDVNTTLKCLLVVLVLLVGVVVLSVCADSLCEAGEHVCFGGAGRARPPLGNAAQSLRFAHPAGMSIAHDTVPRAIARADTLPWVLSISCAGAGSLSLRI